MNSFANTLFVKTVNVRGDGLDATTDADVILSGCNCGCLIDGLKDLRDAKGGQIHFESFDQVWENTSADLELCGI